MRRLLIRPGGIGDCILCFPAMEALRSDYTEIWVPRAVVPLVRFADAVQPLASTGIDLFGLPDLEAPPGLIERLRGFDEVVTWYGSRRDEFRAALSAVAPRTIFLEALPATGDAHAADYFARQVGAPVPAVPHIRCEPEPNGAVWIHPFSGGMRKNWPYDRFEQVARELGTFSSVEWAETQTGCRFDDLFDLARHLSGGALYIGNDSGITHLAAASGAAVVALFGASDPAIWGPRGERTRILQGKDLDSIRIDGVVNAALEMLGGRMSG